MATVKQSELRRVGHDSLGEALASGHKSDPINTVQEAIGIGLLATLLRIADDISALRGMYNATTMLKDYSTEKGGGW